MPETINQRRFTTSRNRTKKAGVKPPAYRQREGYDQAIVTLTDAHTKKRRDYWLGPYGSAESRELYHRVIAEWEADERRLPPHPGVQVKPTATMNGNGHAAAAEATVNGIIRDYWRWAKSYYSPSEGTSIKQALRVLRKLFGSTPAIEFGPNRLRLVRDDMVKGDPTGDSPRKPWSRKYVNGQIHRVCAIFKWAAAHEMLSASVYQQLKTVPALKRGRSTAHEADPIGPVSLDYVNAIRPRLSRQVNALIDLQLHTGARGGELFTLRAIDITMDDRKGIWTISPTDHKTAHHGHTRTIYLGPKAQAVIRPFLAGRAVDAYLFSPAEAEQERLEARAAARKTPLSCGNVPGSNKATERKHPPGEHYTAASYRRAIERACDEANPHPDPVFHPNAKPAPANADGKVRKPKMESLEDVRKRLTAEQREELKRWRAEHRWHPHQLRHTAATLIRREFGLEAARIALGHSSALVTDAVYAERDMEKVVEVMRKIG